MGVNIKDRNTPLKECIFYTQSQSLPQSDLKETAVRIWVIWEREMGKVIACITLITLHRTTAVSENIYKSLFRVQPFCHGVMPLDPKQNINF